MSPLVYVLISGALGVTGQLLLKRGLTAAGPLHPTAGTLLPLLVSLATNPLILLGLAVYVGGTFFWLILLSRVDLSYAYPFASLNYLLILLASWLLLGEQPSPLRLAGVAAICAGVMAVARTPASSAHPAPGVGTIAPAASGGIEG
jgi:drug/metabolite transporter (DMT)-like permease